MGQSKLARRAFGIAFAATMIASGLASAASPAGDVGDYEFKFRDEQGRTAVLAVYPYSDGASPLASVKVKGPKVAWIDSHPLPKGTVAWKVIVQSSDSKSGPWTKESTTGRRTLLANKTGAMETFSNRNVEIGDVDGRFVRIVSKLIWINEDGGDIGWVRHAYTKYGLVESSGIPPAFGDQTATRNGAAPATWTN